MANIKIINIKNEKTQFTVGVMNLIFAVICLLIFIAQIYSFMYTVGITDGETENIFNDKLQTSPPPINDFFRGTTQRSPLLVLLGLFGFAINFLSGLIIFDNIKKQETKKNIDIFHNKVLLPEEKKIVEIIKRFKGEITQSELVKESECSKVKISRIIKKLEANGIIKKHNYGLTNKIILETEIFKK